MIPMVVILFLVWDNDMDTDLSLSIKSENSAIEMSGLELFAWTILFVYIIGILITTIWMIKGLVN